MHPSSNPEESMLHTCPIWYVFLYSHIDRAAMCKLFMVGDTLDPYLEKEHDFSLVLHERDFPGGVTIMANIIRAVERSRKMIMILTK